LLLLREYWGKLQLRGSWRGLQLSSELVPVRFIHPGLRNAQFIKVLKAISIRDQDEAPKIGHLALDVFEAENSQRRPMDVSQEAKDRKVEYREHCVLAGILDDFKSMEAA